MLSWTNIRLSMLDHEDYFSGIGEEIKHQKRKPEDEVGTRLHIRSKQSHITLTGDFVTLGVLNVGV